MNVKPLAGIKIVDFTWSVAGPFAIKFLADYGATVLHVESSTHPDFLRVSGPYKDRQPGIDRSGYFAFFAANKYGMALNLMHPKAGHVTRRLIEWADVIADNFTPGIMSRWGMDYEHVAKIKPEIITFSVSQMGQTGPISGLSGTGTNLVGMAGFTQMTGWPDREPSQPFGGYPDFISGSIGASCLLAALLERKETGRGQHIDVSQLEASIQFLTPSVLEYTSNGRETPRHGNRNVEAAPHGIYPCRGDNSWCAVTVSTEAEWIGFCNAMGNPDWTRDEKFVSLQERKYHEDELDGFVSAWTSQRAADEVMRIMEEHGVAAGVVQSPKDLVADATLRERNTFWTINHPELGDFLHLGELFRLPETPAAGERPAPCIGQHTEEICREWLKMSEEEFTSLLVDGVFE